MKKILIAYVSETGSTKEVAEEIGRVISEDGFQTDVQPVSSVLSADPYDGVIVGAPVKGMRWLPEALQFIEAHKTRLSSIPTAYFLLSVALMGDSPLFSKKIPFCFKPAFAIAKPAATACFGGVMASEPPFILRLVFGLKKGTPKDGRDWQAIRLWAKKTAALF